MRIDGIEGQHPQRPDNQSSPKGPAPEHTDASAGKAVDSSGILAEIRPYIRSVRETDEVNSQAVDEAKELLASGGLQSPEAMRRAAEAIISRGI